MIKVENRKGTYLPVNGKYIAPLKSEIFNERTAEIRSLERSGLIRVTEVVPENPNPVTPKLFGHDDKEIQKEEEKKEIINEDKEKEVEVKPKTTKRKRNTNKKKGE